MSVSACAQCSTETEKNYCEQFNFHTSGIVPLHK